MNIILICNLVFYLSPFIGMIIHDLADKVPEKHHESIYMGTIIFNCLVIVWTALNMTVFGLQEIFDFIPNYLLLYYFVILLISIFYFGSVQKIDKIKAISVAYILVFTSSFFWEIPENIFWQIKRGYHPSIIFTLLGVFPYIWLDKKYRWERSLENIFFILLTWGLTMAGVFAFPSSIDCIWQPHLHICATYFLICRVIAWLALINLFFIQGENTNEHP